MIDEVEVSDDKEREGAEPEPVPGLGPVRTPGPALQFISILKTVYL